MRRVTLGSLQEGLQVVEKGLAATDRVVVSGLQQIRPDVKKVQVKMVPMTAGESAAKPSAECRNLPSRRDEGTRSRKRRTSPSLIFPNPGTHPAT